MLTVSYLFTCESKFVKKQIFLGCYNLLLEMMMASLFNEALLK